MNRGNALIEILVLGFAISFGLLLVASTASRIAAAGEHVAEAAETAAFFSARAGGSIEAESIVRAMVPEAEVTVTETGSQLRVRVSKSISLFGPDGPVRWTVSASATVPMSPYRSRGHDG